MNGHRQVAFQVSRNQIVKEFELGLYEEERKQMEK